MEIQQPAVPFEFGEIEQLEDKVDLAVEFEQAYEVWRKDLRGLAGSTVSAGRAEHRAARSVPRRAFEQEALFRRHQRILWSLMDWALFPHR